MAALRATRRPAGSAQRAVVPLRTPGGVLGAMNVYAHAHDAFDAHAEEVGEMFAVPAAISVLNAQILAQSQRLTTQLQAALQSRPIIDQAIGILRSRNGDTAQEAFDTLRKLSQHGTPNSSRWPEASSRRPRPKRAAAAATPENPAAIKNCSSSRAARVEDGSADRRSVHSDSGSTNRANKSGCKGRSRTRSRQTKCRAAPHRPPPGQRGGPDRVVPHQFRPRGPTAPGASRRGPGCAG